MREVDKTTFEQNLQPHWVPNVVVEPRFRQCRYYDKDVLQAALVRARNYARYFLWD